MYNWNRESNKAKTRLETSLWLSNQRSVCVRVLCFRPAGRCVRAYTLVLFAAASRRIDREQDGLAWASFALHWWIDQEPANRKLALHCGASRRKVTSSGSSSALLRRRLLSVVACHRKVFGDADWASTDQAKHRLVHVPYCPRARDSAVQEAVLGLVDGDEEGTHVFQSSGRWRRG